MDRAEPPSATTVPLSHGEIRTIVIGVMVAMFLAALDQTIIATALPTIGRELGDFEDMAWVVTAYLITATAVTPLYGKFSDIHGRRITLLIAIITFVIGSILCALAPSMLALIAARGVQGLGGGGLISMAQTVVADVAAPRERGRFQAYFASVFAASSLAGPVLGGFIAEHFHWSGIFWINVPVGIVALWMSYSGLKRLPRHERPHKLDVLGAALIMAASAMLMLALGWGGARYPWLSVEIAGLLGASLVLWILFTLRLLTASEPLIPLSVLGNGVVRAGTASACFGMGTLIALTIFLPVYFEAVHGLTASQSGLALIPLTIGTVFGATFAGRTLSHIVHYKRLPMAGLAIAAVGGLVLTAFPLSLPLWLVLVIVGIVSVGLGALLPVSTVAVQNAVPPHQLGTTTAANGFFRSLGGALMVAAFGAILIGGGSVHSAAMLDASAAATDSGLMNAFRWMFFAAFCGFGAALLLLSAMAEVPLRSTVGHSPAAAPPPTGD